MTTIAITNSFSPNNETALTNFETRIKAKLPSDYREFLLAYNGGEPEPRSFEVVDFEGRIHKASVEYFFGISTSQPERGSMRSFELNFQVHYGRLPENLLHIADCVGEDLICISTSGEDYGQIYFWDRDWEPEEQPDYSNVYFIAKSFNEFLGMLFRRTDI